MAPKTRKSAVEALVTITPILMRSGTFSDLTIVRKALYSWAFRPAEWDREPDPAIRDALSWLEESSLALDSLTNPVIIRDVLGACGLKLDGSPASATTFRRKRAVLHNVLGYAVELGYLDSNPLQKVQWRMPASAVSVDRRVVASTAQVETILRHLPDVDNRGDHYVAYFGCLYYGGMRPGEVAQLCKDDLTLPAKGWGRVILTETAPSAGGSWTDTGATRQVRGLKHRGEKDVRSVPIPPELVKLLLDHLTRFGTASDGRLFRAARGGYVLESVTSRLWREARAKALMPEQRVTPLAARPYDLRHAAVSLWMNNGVPAPEVARRVGHGVDVLLRVYAGCIDGDEELVNGRISAALRSSRRGPDRGRAGQRKRKSK